MWSSSGENSKNKGLSRGSCSSSSTTSSSASPFSPQYNNNISINNPRAKTMEEVWKDINLSSLHDHHPNSSRDHPHHDHPNTSSAATNFPAAMIFQDFFAQPFSTKDHHQTTQTTTVSARYGSPVPPPATLLTLNSGSEFNLFGNSVLQPQLSCISHGSALNTLPPFDAFGSLPAGGINANIGKKRFPENDNNSGDRRHKKMIKNRESAARSRARKQAYTNELELEVFRLTQENARLKEQQRQLCLAAANRLPRKLTLQRTSTAPF